MQVGTLHVLQQMCQCSRQAQLQLCEEQRWHAISPLLQDVSPRVASVLGPTLLLHVTFAVAQSMSTCFEVHLA